jgi:hypothetical protein
MRLLAPLGFALGFIIVVVVLNSAVRLFLLPRAAPDSFGRVVFLCMRMLFNGITVRSRTYRERDRIMRCMRRRPCLCCWSPG